MAKREVTMHPASDSLAEQITNAMRGMHDLREENATLREQLGACEHARAISESEVACLQAQLDGERSERRHYHSLANELITRLDVVGKTVEDVMRRAEHEIYSKRKEHPRAELPELQIPEFLRRAAAAAQSEPSEAAE